MVSSAGFATNEKLSCNRLAAELPLFLVYAAATSPGSTPSLSDALSRLAREESLELREFRKLAKIFEKVKRLKSSHYAAINHIASLPCREVSSVFQVYIILSMLKGARRGILLDLANETQKSFSRYLSSKIKTIYLLVEVVTTVIAAIVISVFMASFISLNTTLLYVFSFFAVITSMTTAIIARLEILKTYFETQRHVHYGLITEILLGAAIISMMTNTVKLLQLSLAAASLAIRVALLVSLFRSTVRLKALIDSVSALTEALNISPAAHHYVVARLKTYTRDEEVGRMLSYALAAGRLPSVTLKGVEAKLVLLLTKVLMRAKILGGRSLEAVKVSLSLAKTIHGGSRRLLLRVTGSLLLLSATIATMQAAVIALSKYVYGSVSGANGEGYTMLVMTPSKSYVKLSIAYLTAIGLASTYAITLAAFGYPWYNIAAPILVLAAQAVGLG